MPEDDLEEEHRNLEWNQIHGDDQSGGLEGSMT